VFHILGAIDEFQRELVIEGTREGPGQRPRRGPQAQAERPAGRDHPPDASPDGRRQHTVAEIAEAVSVHRATVYDYLTRQG
jgi:DNA invertase Pin-like site-specific DNA recombinase